MKQTRNTRAAQAHSQRRGVAIIYALFGAMMAAGMVSVMFATAGTASKKEDLSQDRTQARYLAEGAAEVARKSLASAIANWELPPLTGSVNIHGIDVPYAVDPIGPTRNQVDPSGILTMIDTYEIKATASVDGRESSVHRIVAVESTPVFQFAVFYNGDLEVLPGPSMTLGGRVHSNGDMFLGCGGTLTMDTNYVRAVGNMYRKRKNDGSSTGGTVDIRKWVANPYDSSEPREFARMYSAAQMAALGITSSSGYDSDFVDGYDYDGDGNLMGDDDWLPFTIGALDMWGIPDGYTAGSGHTLLTGQHDLLEASAPGIGSIAMYKEVANGDYEWNTTTDTYEFVGAGMGSHGKGYFHENAGLSIIVSEDGLDFDVRGPGGAEFDSGGTSYKQLVINSGAVAMGNMPDMRQSDSANLNTPVLEIDVALLGAANLFPSNGLLYTAQYGMAEGAGAKGTLLKNGAELASKLTLACEGSVYVQGDFNSINKKGASVIGDAVNLLSNSWDGTKTPGTLPSATETTFNAAFITGNYESEPGRYNGGLENLPRFHENWSGVPCNITGSFVNTWDSQFATGDWRGGADRYTAPQRNWAYDTSYNTVANLPPFTPMVINSRQVVTW